MRIVQYLNTSGTWGAVGPEALDKGIGGRESALIHLAQQWSALGHQVTSLVPCDYPAHYEHESGGIASYVPLDASGPILRTIPSDCVVSWEDPTLFSDEVISATTELRVLEMQVAHTHLIEPDNVDKDPFIDVYAVLSGWAGEYLGSCNSNMTQSKLEVLPNGVDLTRWPSADADPRHAKPPFRFWYSSSPDRGLHHLLKLWPKIRDRWPGSELHVAYGLEWAEKLKWSHNGLCERALDVIEGVKQDGVFYHGRIGQKRLALIQSGCHALLYPCDTLQPTETGCITIVEAMAAGKPVITSDADCIPREFGGAARIVPLPWDEEKYFEQVASVMEDPDAYRDMAQAGITLASQRDWADIASDWISMIERRTRLRREREDADDAATGADTS